MKSPSTLARQLALLQSEAAKNDEKLALLTRRLSQELDRGSALENSNLSNDLPSTLEPLTRDLIGEIASIKKIAGELSVKVRSLDTARSNIDSLIARLEAARDFIKGLETLRTLSLTPKEDPGLSQACHFYHTFSDQPDVVTEAFRYHDAPAVAAIEVSESPSSPYFGTAFLEKTREFLLERLNISIASGDHGAASVEDRDERILQAASLYSELGAQVEGVVKLSEYVKSKVQQRYQGRKTEALAAASDLAQIELLRALCESVADTITDTSKQINTVLGPSALIVTIHSLSSLVDRIASQLLEAWAENSEVHRRIAEVQDACTGGITRESSIDETWTQKILSELASIFEIAKLYQGFVQAKLKAYLQADGARANAMKLSKEQGSPVESPDHVCLAKFDSMLDDLSQGYLILQEGLLKKNFDVAMSRDDLSTASSLTSTSVDDIFFLIKHASHLAISSRRHELYVSVLHLCGRLLHQEYGGYLRRGCFTLESQPRCLNNLDVVTTEYIPAFVSRMKKLNVGHEVTNTFETIRTALRKMLKNLLASLITATKDRVVKALRETMRDIGISPPVTVGFAAMQISTASQNAVAPGSRYMGSRHSIGKGESDSLLIGANPAFRHVLNTLLDSYKPYLTPNNFNYIVYLVADAIATEFEKTIMSIRLTYLGAILLEKDLRSLVSAFTSAIRELPLGHHSGRDENGSSDEDDADGRGQEHWYLEIKNAVFERLRIMVAILTLCDAEDVREIRNGAAEKVFKASEIKKIMALRVDLDAEARGLTSGSHA